MKVVDNRMGKIQLKEVTKGFFELEGSIYLFISSVTYTNMGELLQHCIEAYDINYNKKIFLNKERMVSVLNGYITIEN